MQGARKIDFAAFQKALPLLAEEKGARAEDVRRAIVLSEGPRRNSSVTPDFVRLHDDKTTFTGAQTAWAHLSPLDAAAVLDYDSTAVVGGLMLPHVLVLIQGCLSHALQDNVTCILPYRGLRQGRAFHRRQENYCRDHHRPQRGHQGLCLELHSTDVRLHCAAITSADAIQCADFHASRRC